MAGMVVASLFLLLLRQAAVPPHLQAARDLVAAVRPETTSYQHKGRIVVWPDSGKEAECRTDCSGFWNALIPRAYPEVSTARLAAWLGKKHPQAEDYFQAMESGVGFHVKKRVDDIRPGDFIAIKYEPGAENTGHAVIVDEMPQRIDARAPTVDGTTQYTVLVIDVTSTPHGVGDSRGKGAGLGQGRIRLYANSDGTFAGHAWSLSAKSQYRPMSLRPMSVAEIDLSAIPKSSSPIVYLRSFASSRRISR